MCLKVFLNIPIGYSSRSRGANGAMAHPGPEQQPKFLIEITISGTIFEKFSALLHLASN